MGSAKRGDTSEAKSGKPINVVHMPSNFAPSLTSAIIFRYLGFHDCYRNERGLNLPMDEKKKKLFEILTKEMQGENINAFRPQSN